MKALSLEDIIRQFVNINPRVNKRGFHSLLCKVCNDHGKKGDRAGFKFEDGTVGYNCFNCGHSALYDPMKHQDMPHNMKKVLDAFGIAEVDWSPALYSGLLARQHAGVPSHDGQMETIQSIHPEYVDVPPYFYPLTDNPDDDWAQYSIEYLASRQVNWTAQRFFCVKKTDHPDNKRWYGRLIIPCFKDNKLVFWQGRDLVDKHIKKYLSPSIPRDRILSDYTELSRYTEEPLYVTEGWFDAHHLNGVAIFGNQMTPEQIAWLNRTNRRKVIIPDKFGDGQLLAKQAIELGWSVSTPDIGSCKDINEAVLKYGLLYTMKTVQENTVSNFLAMSRVSVYCKP